MSVSKVLHDRGTNVRVGSSTAAKIRAAAKELGYQPNSLARSFRNRKTDTIGLVYETFTLQEGAIGYFSDLLAGITAVTFEHDYSLTICPKLWNASETGIIHDGRFDGLLWCQVNLRERVAEAIGRLPIPVVVLHAPEGALDGVSTFASDVDHGPELAVDHLYRLGHRRIAFLIDDFNEETAEGKGRQNGFNRAMAQRGLKGETVSVTIGVGECEAWLKSKTRPSAVISFSEALGVDLVRTAPSWGIRIPHDLSIVAYDSTTICEATHPRLTAIHQPIRTMAADATKLLLSLIDGAEDPRRHFSYPCGFDVRESTLANHLEEEVTSLETSLYAH